MYTCARGIDVQNLFIAVYPTVASCRSYKCTNARGAHARLRGYAMQRGRWSARLSRPRAILSGWTRLDDPSANSGNIAPTKGQPSRRVGNANATSPGYCQLRDDSADAVKLFSRDVHPFPNRDWLRAFDVSIPTCPHANALF